MSPSLLIMNWQVGAGTPPPLAPALVRYSRRVLKYSDSTALLCSLSELGDLGFGDMVWNLIGQTATT